MPITINWQKSSFSSEGSACIELGIAAEGTVLVRESDAPSTVLVTTPARARALLTLTSMRPPLI